MHIGKIEHDERQQKIGCGEPNETDKSESVIPPTVLMGC